MLAADFDEILWLKTCERDCSANLPEHNPPCTVAVDGLAEGQSNEGVVDEPNASVEKV